MRVLVVYPVATCVPRTRLLQASKQAFAADYFHLIAGSRAIGTLYMMRGSGRKSMSRRAVVHSM